ncbi:MAG: flagellar motor protein MotB [Janthinobacterium lividum]
MSFHFPDRAAARPTWLVTLADLALLLVGFFVLMQARGPDGRALAGAMREGFGSPADAPAPVRRPMPVAAAALGGFAPASAASSGSPRAVIDWARDVARDPRTTLTITGSTDGSVADVDPATGSATILAADRARALAAVLAPALSHSPDQAIRMPSPRASSRFVSPRLAIATATTPGRRAATVTVGFTGTQP